MHKTLKVHNPSSVYFLPHRLSHGNVGGKGAKALGGILKQYDQLQRLRQVYSALWLSVSSCYVCLRSYSIQAYLWPELLPRLNWSQLEGEGAATLEEGLKHCTNLQELEYVRFTFTVLFRDSPPSPMYVLHTRTDHGLKAFCSFLAKEGGGRLL